LIPQPQLPIAPAPNTNTTRQGTEVTIHIAGDTPAHFTLGGIPSTKLAAIGEIQLPLVSFIVRNWNYGRFVGSAIDSIKAQDYPRFETIIVDNASTDESRDVIERHVGDAPHFTIIHADSNLGALGGALRGLEEARGEFIVFVDSDDTLLTNFASVHVQAHLAGRLNIAFTSSAALESSGAGVLVNGHRKRTVIARPAGQQDLRPASLVPRLTTIADDTYATIQDATTILDPRLSVWLWPWSPGTANMYRRFMLDLVAPVSDDPATSKSLSTDGHYNRLCHVLGGSAFIDMPLSTYRIHGGNAHVSVPSLHGMLTDGGPAIRLDTLRIKELIRVLVTQAEDFSWRIGADRYWDTVSMLLDYPRYTGSANGAADVSTFLATQLPQLNAAFGEKETLRQLASRIPSGTLAAAFRRHHGANLPSEIRWELQFTALRRIRGQIRRRLRKWRGR
jgi:hypothetical protein